MKKLFIFLGLLVGLLFGLIFALPYFLPMDMIHSRVINMAHEKTGGDLIIKGQTSFSILPTPSIILNDISFRTATQNNAYSKVEADQIKVKVNFMPLLSKEIQVSEFVIYQPEIDIITNDHSKEAQLRVRKAGTVTAVPTGKGGATTDGTADGEAMPVALSDISLENVRIVDGIIRYHDKKTGKVEIAEAINATVQLKNLDNPLSVNSDLLWHKKKITLVAKLTKSRILMENMSSPLNLKLRSPDLQLDFSGKIDRLKEFGAKGKMRMHSASVRQLLNWTGQEAPLPGGLENLEIHSNITYKPKFIKLTDTKLELDKSKMDGHLTLFLKEAKPRMTGKLALDYLNLNSYLTKTSVHGWVAKNPAEYQMARNTASAASKTDPKIDFQGLNAINANLDLTLGGLLYKKIKLGKTKMQVKINNGLMKTVLSDMQLYKGHGTGLLVLNGRKPRSALTTNFDLKNVSVLPLLTDAANFQWLSGNGNIKFAVKSAGKTVSGFKKSLNGTSDIKFLDGAIEGVNIPHMLRNVTSGALLGLSKNTTQKTDFSALTAHFDIKKGVIHNNDLKLASPLLRVSGKGTANLVTERLDYRIEPKIVASLEGQNGKNASGINIPVNIKGSFSDPKIKPDLSKILENPKELLNGVKDLGKSLGNRKDIKDALKGLGGLFR